MNIQEFAEYVEQQIDDSFATNDIARWFNTGISQYNLLPPLTTYPYISLGQIATTENGLLDVTTNYPLADTFMLGVMLPYVSSTIKGSESALNEKQLFLQDFRINASTFKRNIDIPFAFLLNKKNDDLSIYEIGEGIFLSDFTKAPFAGQWQAASRFNEIVIEKEETEE